MPSKSKSKLDMVVKIQDKVIDTNLNHSFSISQKDNTKNLYTLHIYNDSAYKFNMTKNNELFFKQFTKMLFDTDKSTKKGCFNQQYDDDSTLYNDNVETLTNRYLDSEYTFILINENCEPLSAFCINNNYIWNVCTNYLHQNKGYMMNLLGHVMKLIKYNKLKNKYSVLRLTIKKNNPIKKMLLKFYSSFGFSIESESSNEILMINDNL